MARIVRTPKELQAIVSRMLQAMPSVRKAGVSIAVPLPHRRPADSAGCNWTLPPFATGTDFADTVQAVIEAAREQFNLQE